MSLMSVTEVRRAEGTEVTDPQQERGDRARAWLDEWAKRWEVEDGRELVTALRDKAHELHELVGKKRGEEADRTLAELEFLADQVESLLDGGGL